MTAPAVHRHRLWLAIALALTVLKLWLTRGQGVFALGSADHDDRLFIELAQHLIRGEWLGPYNELTLAKGPFYPLFIAGAFSLGVPLFLAQHVFYAAACALFVRALRPAVTSAGPRLAIYALLLWNPMTYDGPSMGRVLAAQVTTPLGLVIIAGFTALYLRRAGAARGQLPWAILLGLAGAAYYLTGEELMWLVPSVLLLAGACFHLSRGVAPAVIHVTARWLGLALAIAVVPVLFVCAVNLQHYDRFTITELRAHEAASAHVPGSWSRLRSAADFVVRFSRFSARAPASLGSPEELHLFQGLTRERLSPPRDQSDTVGADRYLLNVRKTNWLHQIGKGMRPLLLLLFVGAQVLAVIRGGLAWRRKSWSFPLTLAAASWGACAAAVLLHAHSGSASLADLAVYTFAPVYPLILVFVVATFWDAISAWLAPGDPALIAGASGKESAGTGTAHLYG